MSCSRLKEIKLPLMKTILISFVFCSLLFMGYSQSNVTTLEYFIGSDPGTGNATAVVISPGTSISETFEVPVSGMVEGLHFLHVRIKNQENKWSLFGSRQFYIMNGLNSENITAAEYFLGDDPGLGNATAIAISPGPNLNIAFNLPVNSLSGGIHYLHVRVKDSNNKWSLYARKPFYLMEGLVANEITAVEYFIGDDPGIGNANPLSITAGNSLNVVFEIPINELEENTIHHLHLRVKDSDDKWSLYAKKLFYVMPADVDHEITEAEYFIDIDPGLGEGNELTITTGTEIEENFIIEVPDSLSFGDHFLHIRIWNSNDKWSHYARVAFEVSDNIGLDDISSILRIYPNPVKDRLYFQTEHLHMESWRIIDLNGKLIRELQSRENSVDLSFLASGTYLIQVYFAEGVISRRIVKL